MDAKCRMCGDDFAINVNDELCDSCREHIRKDLDSIQDEDWEDWEREAWQEQEELNPFVLDCKNPDCIMPGPRMLSECHTAADYIVYTQKEEFNGQ